MPALERRSPVARHETALARRHRPDYMLVVLMLILLVIGLVVIFSISPGLSAARNVSESYYTMKQLTAIGLGLVTFVAMATIPLNFWRRLQWPLIGLAVIVSLIALLTPVTPEYPAQRWVRLGDLSFQSVELIKFTLIFVLSAFLAARVRAGEIANFQKNDKPLLIALGIIGFVVAVMQSDLGSFGVLTAMIVAMCLVAGMPLKRLAIVGTIILLAGAFAIVGSDYRRDRFATFLSPEQDCQSTGYQACQALIAVGSGGVFGKGIGHSVQAYGYLPEAANDSIFAIFAEKFGFVGVATLVALLLTFFGRIKSVMERAPDVYSRLIVAGVLAWLSTQAVINIGAMLGVLPLKGITLPFISYGGTSIIFVTAAVGLVFNISRYTTHRKIPGDTNRQDSNSRHSGSGQVIRGGRVVRRAA